MEIIVERLMTSSKKVDMDEFLSITRSDEVHKFANSLTSDLDTFVKIIGDEIGWNRFMRILGISDDINTILLYPIMMRFTEIMTHERGCDLALQVLNVCNIHHKKLFYQVTYRHTLALARDERGCTILKKVITIADDFFKDGFLDLISEKAFSLSTCDLGVSLIRHVLKLDFTHRTTQDDSPLHELMAEFDEIHSKSSDIVDDHQLHKLVSKLTSDSNLFVELVKTRRGSLMVQIIIGKSEEIDRVIFAAIKQRFTDVTTDFYGYRILLRIIIVFHKRENVKLYDQILRLIGDHALYLTKDPNMGNYTVQQALRVQSLDCTESIACGLHSHYIEVSFLEHGSKIVEKLLRDGKTAFPLMFMVMEIVRCDEDTLVRLAKDEYGNQVLKTTMEVAKELSVDYFGDIVEKLKPCLDNLRGSLGENIATIIDLEEIETVKNQIVSQGY